MYIIAKDSSIVEEFELLEDAEAKFESMKEDDNTYLDSWDDIDYQEWKQNDGDMNSYSPDTTLDMK